MKYTLLALIMLAAPASAATCAHVESGQALDTQPCTATADYLSRYAPQVTKGWTAVVVPDGTLHNAAATRNQDGTWRTVNPIPVPAPPVTVLTVTAFKKRLTLAERAGVAGSADVTVKVFWDELNTATTVDLQDPDTISGVNYLASIGLLTAPRAVEILTP